MAILAPAEVTLIDVAEVAADPAHRTALTPFGGLPGKPQRYVGRAVMWKRNAAAMPSKVRAGLDRAIGISRGCKGVLGVGINPLTGEVVPAKVICQLKAAGKVKA